MHFKSSLVPHPRYKLVNKFGNSNSIKFIIYILTCSELLTKLLDKILPYCDSLGMNEQELPNLLSVLKTG